ALPGVNETGAVTDGFTDRPQSPTVATAPATYSAGPSPPPPVHRRRDAEAGPLAPHRFDHPPDPCHHGLIRPFPEQPPLVPRLPRPVTPVAQLAPQAQLERGLATNGRRGRAGRDGFMQHHHPGQP